MPWGVVAGAAIGAIGSVVSGNEQASGQEAAANTQQAMFNTINAQEQPFIGSGYTATGKLDELLGINAGRVFPGGAVNGSAKDYGSLTKPFTSADYLANQDPGYKFQLDQGSQALRNASSTSQGALSGAAMKDLINYNQSAAATGYQNAFDRYNTQQNNVFARLSGLAGMGQNAASNVGTAGTSLGTGIAQAEAGAAGSRAAGIAGAAQSLGSGATMGAFLGSGGNSWSGSSNNPANASADDIPNNFAVNTSDILPKGS